MKISFRQIPDSSLNCNKGECHFTGDKDTIRSVFSNLEKRPKWDTMLAKMEIVEDLGTKDGVSHSIGYALYKSPSMFVSNRDFVYVDEEATEADGSFYFTTKSVTHPKAPETKGNVRGNIEIAGYYLKPTNAEQTEWDCTYITVLDLCGSIPSAIVRSVNKDQPSHLGLLRDEIAKEYKNKK